MADAPHQPPSPRPHGHSSGHGHSPQPVHGPRRFGAGSAAAQRFGAHAPTVAGGGSPGTLLVIIALVCLVVLPGLGAIGWFGVKKLGDAKWEMSPLRAAAQTVERAQVVALAWRRKAQDSKGDFGAITTPGDLVPGYLETLPQPPAWAAKTAFGIAEAARIDATDASLFDIVFAELKDAEVCRLTARLAKLGFRAGPVTSPGGPGDLNALRDVADLLPEALPQGTGNPNMIGLSDGLRYGCVYHEATGNSVLDPEERMWFVYRARDPGETLAPLEPVPADALAGPDALP